MSGSTGGSEWLIALYWFCLALGGGYVILQFIMLLLGGVLHGMDIGGGHAELGGGGAEGEIDLDADMDHDLASHSPGVTPAHGHAETGADAHIGPYSPMAIATFMAGFGGMGLGLNAVGLKSLGGIPGAVFGGLLSLVAGIVAAAVLIVVLNKFFEATSASSGFSLDEVIGAEAEVCIPMDGVHTGQITFHAGYGTRTEPAKPIDDSDKYAQGQKVWIVKIDDGVFKVADFDRATHLNVKFRSEDA